MRGNTISRDQNAGLSFIGDADAGAGAITAMCFDDGGRRLITGSHDGGCIQVWNFSNGCLLRTLVKIEDSKLQETARQSHKKDILKKLSMKESVTAKPSFQKKHNILARRLGMEAKLKTILGPAPPPKQTSRQHSEHHSDGGLRESEP